MNLDRPCFRIIVRVGFRLDIKWRCIKCTSPLLTKLHNVTVSRPLRYKEEFRGILRGG